MGVEPRREVFEGTRKPTKNFGNTHALNQKKTGRLVYQKVKLLAEPGSLRLIGAQMVGGEGIKERADFLAMAVRTGITLRDLATMENVYSPPIGALNEPIALAAQDALSRLGS